MKHPVQAAAEAWQKKAIEACQNDPEFMATGMCPTCVMDHPCICDMDRATKKMREYYEANRRIEPGLFRGGRAEPQGKRSWGVPYDVLMTKLYMIAKKEILESQRKWQEKTAS